MTGSHNIYVTASNESRVLVLAPAGTDTTLILEALQREGIVAEPCRHAAELAAAVRFGAGAVMVAEESLGEAEARIALQSVMAEQAAWSDLPVLLLSAAGPDATIAPDALAGLGNVTVISRPTPVEALVFAASTALRTRHRQYLMRAADERKDAFLATLAHELRNPLAPLGNAVSILKRKDIAPPLRLRAVEVIERQFQQLTRLVDDLLDIARISQGRATLLRTEVDFSQIVHTALETSMPAIEAMQHTLVTHMPPQPVRLEADALRLAQCLSNLLNNAARFTPRGGRIELSADVDGPELLIEVRDNGVGITAETLPRLFDVFASREGAQGKLSSGLGVGLSIVKTYVEMHGGSVGAYSEGDGRGSTFVVRLPCRHADAALPGRGSRSHEAPAVLACSVLVVDDNTDSADSLGEFLSLYGHQVSVAYTGQSGWDAALRNPPDVAVLDIGLPDMNGLQLAQRFRSCPTTAHARLIALSGWGQAADYRRSAEAGFDQHLVKPADLEQVLAGIAAATRIGSNVGLLQRPEAANDMTVLLASLPPQRAADPPQPSPVA